MMCTIRLVDTTRDELRDRIDAARDRFDRLIRSADPLARPPRSQWTVQQVAAHVLTVAHRYRELATGRMYRRADTPRGVDVINQEELEAAMAPMPVLADELLALAPQIDDWFDTISDDQPRVLFHGGATVSGITGQTNWLGELLLHGQDIAHAVKAPWPLAERDMLLINRGVMEVVPGYLRAGLPGTTDVCVAVRMPGARPYLMHIHDGTVETRPCRADDHPDAVLRLRASTFTQLLYQRIGPLRAARQGLLIIGGRRPWVALRLQAYFEPA